MPMGISKCVFCGNTVSDQLRDMMGEAVCPSCFQKKWDKAFNSFQAEASANPFDDMEIIIKKHFAEFNPEWVNQMTDNFIRKIG